MRQPLFAAAAHLIEPEGGERTDQRIARKQWEQQRERVLAGGCGKEKNPDHEIDEGEEEKMGGHGAEIAETLCESVSEVSEPDLADDGKLLNSRRCL